MKGILEQQEVLLPDLSNRNALYIHDLEISVATCL